MDHPASASEDGMPKRSTRLGLIAIFLSLSPALFCGISIVLGLAADQYHYSIEAVIIQALSCTGILLALTGVVLGVISLVRKEPKKGLGIVSIILGILLGVALGFTQSFLFIIAFSAM